MEAKGSSGQSTAYNTYATLLPPNPLFQGFSSSQNVNKEIINFTIQNVSGRFRNAYYIPGFCSGMFLYKKIKKYDILYISKSKMIIWR